MNLTAELEKSLVAIQNEVPGDLLFLKLSGSHSHNLDLPTSDFDCVGIYVAPTQKLVGIRQPAETVTRDKPDWTVHEVGKFCSLLLKGNPTIIEMLFSDQHYMAVDPFWPDLRKMRKSFLTAQTLKQYLGYCQGQLRKLAAHGGKGGLHTSGSRYNTKWAYHMVRLAMDAQSIAAGFEPRVWKEGPERELLMEIRTGKKSQEWVEEYTKGQIRAVDCLKPWPLEDKADEAVLEKWLGEIRNYVWHTATIGLIEFPEPG